MLIPGAPPPMKGFTSILPRCEACKAYKKCRSPKIPVSGEGKKRILIVGSAPGKEEDRVGRPFAGAAGKRLYDELIRNGLTMRSSCWVTNAVICKVPGAPSNDEIEWCRPNLIGTLKKLKPKVIIPLGDEAIRSLISYVWRDSDIGGVERWAGFQIPCRPLNAWICPTYHPADVLKWIKKPIGRAVAGQFSQHIEAAVSLRGRPYAGDLPNEQAEVEVILDPDEAAEEIEKEMALGGLTSFDYETNMLKPDGSKAAIASCAICFRGERTIAYPWHGAAIEATKTYLRSPLPKVGANIKFEERWTMAKLGVRVRNWEWDSMQAAHVLDCRRGITSVKFQAFIRLGTPIWDRGIKKYLVSDGPSVPNRVFECPLRDLLLYNGVDSLVEWRLALCQAKLLGVTLPGVK